VPVALWSAYQVPAAGRHTARSFWPRGGGAAAYPAVQQDATLSHMVISRTQRAYGLLTPLSILNILPPLPRVIAS